MSRVNLVFHVGFVATGVVTTLLGPILPVLSSRWSLTDAQAGRFFTAQFTASIIGIALSGWIIPKRGFRSCLRCGYLLMTLGIGALRQPGSCCRWWAIMLMLALYLWDTSRTPFQRAASAT